MMERDLNGQVIIPGRPSTVLRWDAASQTMPPWMTLATAGTDADATATYGTDVEAGPYVQFNPAPTSGRRATFVGAEYDTSKLAYLRLTLQNLRFSEAASSGFAIALWNDGSVDKGARLSKTTTGGFPVLGAWPIAGNTDLVLPYPTHSNGEYKKPRTLSLIVYPQTKWIYALENDSCFAAQQFPNMANGLVRPRFRCETGSASAKWMRFEAIEVEASYKP